VYCPADATTLTADQVGVLRSVLDQRRVGVRDHQRARSWPARTQLVLGTTAESMTGRLSTLADRIDLHLNLAAPCDVAVPSEADGIGTFAAGPISRARTAAAQRWSPNTPERLVLNAEVAPADLRRTLHLLPGAYLRGQADTARLSTRGWVGTLRLAWTIADLAGHGHPTRRDVDEAIAWRTSGLGHR
jgi:predicted ATPase with chaperone activity